MATINLFGGGTPTQITLGGTGGTDAATARTSLGITNVATQSVTNHNVLVGGASNAITSIAPAASGTYLVSNGAGADPSFQTRAAGSMVLISTQSAAGVINIDFINLNNTYNVYVLNMSNFIPVANDSVPLLRYSTNNGSSYSATNYLWVNTFSTSSTGATFGAVGTANLAIAAGLGPYPNGTSSGTAPGFNGTFRLYGIGVASRSITTGHWSATISSGTSWRQGRADASNSAATTVNAIRILNSSGNFASGTVSLYGIAK